MSTKIYNGKKIKRELIDDIDKFSLLFSKIKTSNFKSVENIINQRLMYKIYENIFYFIMNDTLSTVQDKYSMDLCGFENNIKEIKELYFFDFINELNVKDGFTKKYYNVLYLYDMKNYYFGYDFYSAVKIDYEKYGFEEYMYYNNTDRPDNVTEKQWEKRSKEWDIALDSNMIKIDIINERDVILILKSHIEKIKNLDLNKLVNLNKLVEIDISNIVELYFMESKINENPELDYRTLGNQIKEGLYKEELQKIKEKYLKRKNETNLNDIKNFKLSLKGGDICISK